MRASAHRSGDLLWCLIPISKSQLLSCWVGTGRMGRAEVNILAGSEHFAILERPVKKKVVLGPSSVLPQGRGRGTKGSMPPVW